MKRRILIALGITVLLLGIACDFPMHVPDATKSKAKSTKAPVADEAHPAKAK